MESLDGITPEVARLFVAKEQRRHDLARLPFPEKVRAVIQLQEMAAPILAARGRTVERWQIRTSTSKVSVTTS
jgi:hypothetical protein